MEFTVGNFVEKLRQVIYDNFPYESDEKTIEKHPKRPLHIRDIAFGYLPSFNQPDGSIYFDIGSDYAEEYYPYYHILEDSEVIHIKYKGTKGSKGSQDRISDKAARNYGKVSWNGKIFSREYVKNVRGARSRAGKSRQYIVGSDGVVYKLNQDSTYYYNKHYKYIERILDQTLPFIAQDFGLKMQRTVITGLEEDYIAQEQETMAHDYSEGDTILNILDSFEGE